MRSSFSYGKHLGLAFQLQDDVLDFVGDPKVCSAAASPYGVGAAASPWRWGSSLSLGLAQQPLLRVGAAASPWGWRSSHSLGLAQQPLPGVGAAAFLAQHAPYPGLAEGRLISIATMLLLIIMSIIITTSSLLSYIHFYCIVGAGAVLAVVVMLTVKIGRGAHMPIIIILTATIGT